MDLHEAARILVVDDDRDMAALLRHTLTQDRYDVAVAHSGAEGLRKAYAFQPDLILLDLLMPGMDGWDVLRRIRQLSDVPVIMVSAVCEEDAKVRGLDLGADDFVIKPFGLEELKARVHAVLRRAALLPSNGRDLLRFDDDSLVIDPYSQNVIVNGQSVSLTQTEYRLLICLAYNAGRVLGKGQILEAVWGRGYEESLGSVKVYIRRLRSKIEPDPRSPRFIRTRRGSGYYLAERNGMSGLGPLMQESHKPPALTEATRAELDRRTLVRVR
jgi:DNA-binding response OmpR family regulator